jgi:hypothetical protein
MERVVITISAFISPPFEDCGTACTVVTAPVSCHTIVIETPALAAVMLNSRDLRILAQVGCVVHNKECSESSVANDSFNMLFLVRH